MVFWKYRLLFSDVNESMNNIITVLIHYSFYTYANQFILFTYLFFFGDAYYDCCLLQTVNPSYYIYICLMNINITKFLNAWMNAITSSDNKLDCDCTANYGHSNMYSCEIYLFDGRFHFRRPERPSQIPLCFVHTNFGVFKLRYLLFLLGGWRLFPLNGEFTFLQTTTV